MLKEYIEDVCKKAKEASACLINVSEDKINAVFYTLIDLIEKNRENIKKTNAVDIENAKKSNLSFALVDRLLLNDKRIDGLIESLKTLIALRSPVGEVIDGWVIENGLKIEKVRVPIGVVGIIYESRPNVTVDAAALCLKSSNCAVLRGGKEAFYSNKFLSDLIKDALVQNGFNKNCVGFIEKTDRDGVLHLAQAYKYIDVIVPRGGEGLIRFVFQNATVSVIKHDKGLCHTYIDKSADLDKALSIAYNAKVQRPGVCNAMETLLVHKDIAGNFLPRFKEMTDKVSVELRGCEKTTEILDNIKLAEKDDWGSEYLDLILSVKIVENMNEAVEHIQKHGSNHSEAIVTEDYSNAEEFLNRVDASCVYVNASTRFTDGGVFGFGAEIGISTNKLHARGPVGLSELTTYKYKIRGNGQIRE